MKWWIIAGIVVTVIGALAVLLPIVWTELDHDERDW